MSFVGIDVGGTFLKAAILTRAGDVGPVARLPVPDFLDTAGAAREIDPEALVSAVRGLVALVANDADVGGIFVTGQMAGIAFIDEGGRAVAPLISWQDTRADDVDAVARALGPDNLADLGDGLRAGLPLVTLRELGVPAGASVTSLIGFIAGSLCDARVPFVHATDAAAWGMVDVRHRHWSEPALALLGLQASSLPSLSWAIVAVGTSSRFGVPVFCAVGDHQAALLGAGLVVDGVSVNLATGCQVSVLSSSIDSPAQLRPFFFEDVYVHTITHLPAGRLLTAAVRECRGSVEPVDWAWAAENVRSDARIGLTVETIARGVAGAVDRLGASGLPVLFSGGVVQQFAPVRERIIELLDVPATVYQGDDAALAGLAALAARIEA